MDEAAGKVLIVRSGTEHYALDMTTVQEAVYHPDITVLPRTTGFIAGMCLWRGKQVPVADLGLFLGKSLPASSGDLVMTVVAGKETGLLVEEIGPIVDIPFNSLITVDKNFIPDQEKVLQAFEHQGELVFIIETKALRLN
ncbi:chemotaxis protein CheW [candidate division TA06 bacterium]|uniref:Chemotaxis protein CheW n=1 Tax=candidate division TA06 bacterium TaxID=2250710 RepID=A0A933ID55_UNCT6|nr:chemotaxis protein CheW [candidate division TA06 bacterium]